MKVSFSLLLIPSGGWVPPVAAQKTLPGRHVVGSGENSLSAEDAARAIW
jgi:hypothetical protein